MQNKSWLLGVLVLGILFSYVSLTSATVLFQDDFENGLGNWQTENANIEDSEVGVVDSDVPHLIWPHDVKRPCPGNFSGCGGDGKNDFVYFYREDEGGPPKIFRSFNTTGYNNVQIRYFLRSHIDYYGFNWECSDTPLVVYRIGHTSQWYVAWSFPSTSCMFDNRNWDWGDIQHSIPGYPHDLENKQEVQIGFVWSTPNDKGPLGINGDDHFFIDDFQLTGDPMGGGGGGVICNQNSNCGTDGYAGGSFCSGNMVVRNYQTFTCNNPGTTSSYCFSSTIQQTINICADYCSNGACGTFSCHNNTECNDGNISTQDVCLNPSTTNSSCQHNLIRCSANTDCGTGFGTSLFCSGKDIKQNYTSFTCNNPGTTGSFCINSTQAVFNQTCTDACSNGQCQNFMCYNDQDCNDNNAHTRDGCHNPGTINSNCTHDPITCLSNLDCGTDTFVGSEFCTGNSVSKNFLNFTCLNPGTAGSYCSNSTAPRLITDCVYKCVSGSCLTCQDEDSDGICNDYDLCPTTLLGVAVDSNGCSQIQFCRKQPVCGLSCDLADWKNDESGVLNPRDCTTALIMKEGSYTPACAALIGPGCG